MRALITATLIGLTVLNLWVSWQANRIHRLAHDEMEKTREFQEGATLALESAVRICGPQTASR